MMIREKPWPGKSSGTGDYIFPAVPVGTYRLEAQSPGFQDFTATGILVNLNATVTYDVKLSVGANAQAVEVTAEAPLVDTTTTQLGAVINERAVQNLPLNSRDTYQLLQLQPGVQGVGGSDLFYGSDKAGAVSVNGGRGALEQLQRERRRRQRPLCELAGNRAFAGRGAGIPSHH